MDWNAFYSRGKQSLRKVAQREREDNSEGDDGESLYRMKALEAQGHVLKYQCFEKKSSKPLSWRTVLNLWQNEDTRFLNVFRGALSPHFSDFFWECSPLTDPSAPFEFVVMDANGVLDGRKAKSTDFDSHLTKPGAAPIAVFQNLGGDATLVVPNRQSNKDETYGHLKAFAMLAPLQQQENLWKRVAEEVEKKLKAGQPVWLSTDGRGVPWLHVRLDSHPKWYKHNEYRNANWAGKLAANGTTTQCGHLHSGSVHTDDKFCSEDRTVLRNTFSKRCELKKLHLGSPARCLQSAWTKRMYNSGTLCIAVAVNGSREQI